MQASEYPQRVTRQVRIKNVDPISLAKFQGLICAILGLIAGCFVALFALMGHGLFGGAGVFAGIGAVIIMPIMYGIGGFIGGLITAIIYNAAAGVMGGVDITVE